MNRLARHLAACAPLLMTAFAAHAQTLPRYAATVLATPSGATNVSAFSLDANGVARGSANTTTSTVKVCYGDSGIDVIDLFPRFCKVDRYTLREATWAAGTATRQTPVLGTTNFGTMATLPDGTTVGMRGEYVSLPFQSWDPVYAGLYAPASPWSVTTTIFNTGTSASTLSKVSSVIRKGSKITTIGLPPSTGLVLGNFPQAMEVRGITASGTALVNTYASDLLTSVPYLFNGTKFTKFNDTLAPSKLRATAINEQGDVAGLRTLPPKDSSSWPQATPIHWVNGIAVELGGADLLGFVPEALNKSGQILLHRQNLGAGMPANEAAIWFNGAFTPILGTGGDGIAAPADTVASRDRIPVAMNNRGDVVGCGAFPFVYRDGVVYDLNRVIAASGLTTPNGNPLYCPSAINDQGAILVNYKLAVGTAQTRGFGWLRLTPLP